MNDKPTAAPQPEANGGTTETATQAWEHVLGEFENAVLAPVVPGELDSWTATTEEAFESLSNAYTQKIKGAHEEQFRQMGEQDEEMLPRIEDLRQEDSELAGLLKAFRLRLNHFSRIAEDKTVDAEEVEASDLDAKRGELAEEAAELARRIRAQEASLNTWFAEAFMRDRGPVD